MSAPPGARRVLALNAGSSSLKLALFAVDGAAPGALLRGAVEGIGTGDAVLRMAASGVAPREERHDVPTVAAAVPLVLAELDRVALSPHAIGHRIVHGGPHHLAPARVDGDLLASLDAAIPFAPLHLPAALGLLAAVAAHSPATPQVVCFDTAFFARLPLLARRLPLPARLFEQGIRRYGFHGLSYEWIVRALGAHAAGRVVVAHLGNGASMAAIRDGDPVDTTMGLTPSGGLVMGTRTGDLDPGVVLHLARAGLDAAGLEQVLDHDGGLIALSETTSDMRALLELRAHDPRAALAVDAFTASARKWVGALAAVLGGLDGLVFTGGIGEHASAVRAEICAGLGHLGIAIDAGRNARGEAVISAEGSPCTVRVIRTDEEAVIASHTAGLAFG